jgi:hypothetical protein
MPFSLLIIGLFCFQLLILISSHFRFDASAAADFRLRYERCRDAAFTRISRQRHFTLLPLPSRYAFIIIRRDAAITPFSRCHAYCRLPPDAYIRHAFADAMPRLRLLMPFHATRCVSLFDDFRHLIR